jgi:TM2 domain-containing membrane protein YozV
MRQMRFYISSIDKNIVQIYNTKTIQIWIQNVIHQSHKDKKHIN